MEILPVLLNVAVTVFAVSSMLSVGFGHKLRDVISPLRDIPGLITAVVANFVLVPLLAVGIVWLIPLDRGMATGMIIVAAAAGAPMAIKLASNAGENVAFAAAILVLLLVVSIVYMPLVIPLLAEGGSVSAWSIARPLVLTMLMPLAVGFLIKIYIPRLSDALLPYLGIITNVSLVALVALTLYLNFSSVIGVFGTGGIQAALLLVAGSFAIGYAVGTFDKSEKTVLGFATAQRNFAAANVVAIQAFTDSGVLVMAIVISMVAMLLLPLSLAFGKRTVKDIAVNKDAQRKISGAG
ncbi:MAG: transporter [Acidobacteriota bacterium]